MNKRAALTAIALFGSADLLSKARATTLKAKPLAETCENEKVLAE